MLELMRLFAIHPEKLHHDVIFLFNGAEESSLQVILPSGGFYFPGCPRFYNPASMEALRPGIHQPRGQRKRRKGTSFPSGALESVVVELVPRGSHPPPLQCHRTGSIPEWGVSGRHGLPGIQGLWKGSRYEPSTNGHFTGLGLDLAFVQNGYWWHTEFDEEKRITNGSLQRAGSTISKVYNINQCFRRECLRHPLPLTGLSVSREAGRI